MGRKRKHNKHLPQRVYQSHGAYYYACPQTGKWLPLGRSEGDMYRTLAELKESGSASEMSAILRRYELECVPNTAPATQYKYRRQLKRLNAVFGHQVAEDIKSMHIARYLDEHPSPISANREIGLLSHVFTKAIRWGYVERNPCQGVERNKERPRRRYVTDEEFNEIYTRAPEHIQILMDLAYLTGQRQGDLINIRLQDLRKEGLYFKQSKTGKELIVRWSDELRAVVARARAIPSTIQSMWLIYNRRGQPYTSGGIQCAWQRLMKRCFEQGFITERFQFRDIRAKARTDGEDPRLLGHANPEAMARIYKRKPDEVEPVK